MNETDEKILDYMRKCKKEGVVPNKKACAEYIGMKRTTLLYHIEKNNKDHWVKLMHSV